MKTIYIILLAVLGLPVVLLIIWGAWLLLRYYGEACIDYIEDARIVEDDDGNVYLYRGLGRWEEIDSDEDYLNTLE